MIRRLILSALLLLPFAVFAQETDDIGHLSFPILFGDGGIIAIQAGDDITIEWVNAPSGAAAYVFTWLIRNPTGDATMMLGIDDMPQDGISIQWEIPEHLHGEPSAVAIYPDGHTITLNPTHLEYISGDAPPDGICVAGGASMSGSPEIFANPPEDVWDQLGYLNHYAPVLNRQTDQDGNVWLEVDLRIEQLYTSDELPSTAFVYSMSGGLRGPCDAFGNTN